MTASASRLWCNDKYKLSLQYVCWVFVSRSRMWCNARCIIEAEAVFFCMFVSRISCMFVSWLKLYVYVMFLFKVVCLCHFFSIQNFSISPSFSKLLDLSFSFFLQTSPIQTIMASSSHEVVDELENDNFDQHFDEYFDQMFDNVLNDLGDQQEERRRRKKRVYIEKNREAGNIRLWNDYFSETPTCPDNLFRRRFRMNKPLFMKIVDRLSNEMELFQQKQDGLGRLGLSTLQKCTATIRVLAYGTAADAVDEYLRLGSTTTRSCLKNFVEGIVNLFGDEYLR